MLHSLLTDPSVSSDDFVTDMLIQRHMQCNIFVFLGDVTPHCVISREVQQTTESSDTTELRISGTFRRSKFRTHNVCNFLGGAYRFGISCNLIPFTPHLHLPPYSAQTKSPNSPTPFPSPLATPSSSCPHTLYKTPPPPTAHP